MDDDEDMERPRVPFTQVPGDSDYLRWTPKELKFFELFGELWDDGSPLVLAATAMYTAVHLMDTPDARAFLPTLRRHAERMGLPMPEYLEYLRASMCESQKFLTDPLEPADEVDFVMEEICKGSEFDGVR